jgi:hypothetical protein
MPNYRMIGLLLICATTSIYLYHNPGTIDRSEISEIRGILLESPYETSHGGDMPRKFLVLRLRGLSNEFYINNCSYSQVHLEKVLSLVQGDSVALGVVENIVTKGKINIYELHSIRLGSLLHLEDYNSCNRTRWKPILRLAMIITVILIIKLGVNIWDKFR